MLETFPETRSDLQDCIKEASSLSLLISSYAFERLFKILYLQRTNDPKDYQGWLITAGKVLPIIQELFQNYVQNQAGDEVAYMFHLLTEQVIFKFIQFTLDNFGVINIDKLECILENFDSPEFLKDLSDYLAQLGKDKQQLLQQSTEYFQQVIIDSVIPFAKFSSRPLILKSCLDIALQQTNISLKLPQYSSKRILFALFGNQDKQPGLLEYLETLLRRNSDDIVDINNQTCLLYAQFIEDLLLSQIANLKTRDTDVPSIILDRLQREISSEKFPYTLRLTILAHVKVIIGFTVMEIDNKFGIFNNVNTAIELASPYIPERPMQSFLLRSILEKHGETIIKHYIANPKFQQICPWITVLCRELLDLLQSTKDFKDYGLIYAGYSQVREILHTAQYSIPQSVTEVLKTLKIEPVLFFGIQYIVNNSKFLTHMFRPFDILPFQKEPMK